MFFLPPVYKEEDWKCYHVFECAAKKCCATAGQFVKCNIDTTNATSTSNLHGHAACFYGEEVAAAAMKVTNLDQACKVLKSDKNNLWNGSITLAFQKAGQELVTYSITTPSNVEVWANHIKWMCESKQPFKLVHDPGYHQNMKVGRLHQYVPSATVVSCDVRGVFTEACKKITSFLQVHCGQYLPQMKLYKPYNVGS